MEEDFDNNKFYLFLQVNRYLASISCISDKVLS